MIFVLKENEKKKEKTSEKKKWCDDSSPQPWVQSKSKIREQVV